MSTTEQEAGRQFWLVERAVDDEAWADVASQVGMTVDQLVTACGHPEPRQLGYVEAATKGAAINAAFEKFGGPASTLVINDCRDAKEIAAALDALTSNSAVESSPTEG